MTNEETINVNPTGVLYREPAAARVAYRLIWLNLFQAFLIIALVGISVFLYLRRPERVIIREDAKGEQLLMVDNRSYGQISNLALEPDRPTNGQKIFAAKEFAALLYEVDLTTRTKAVKRVLGMMPTESANLLYQYLLKNNSNPTNNAGVALAQERSENWAAHFTVKDVTLDARDPNTVNLIGEQEITKNINGNVQEAKRQIQLAVKLHPDPAGRQDANLQTGFQILSFTFKELPR